MHFTFASRLFVGLFVVLIALTKIYAQEIKIEWQTCVKLDTLVSSQQACYIVGEKSDHGMIQVQIGFGLNINAGTVMVGGGASTMQIATITYPSSENSIKALKQAIKRAEQELKQRGVQERLLEEYNKANGRSPSSKPESWTVPELIEKPGSALPPDVLQTLKRYFG